MSGANRLINSENTVHGNKLETLKEKLANANTAACEAQDEGFTMKENERSDAKTIKFKD